MKKLMLMVYIAMIAVAPAKAQWVVTDPTNLAQGIVNTAQEIVETSSTASNMINNFKEVQKVFNQGKEYYDALKAVNNLVKDARKVQQVVLMVGDISDIYVTNFGKMMNDPNFSQQELSAIAYGYSKLLNESTNLLNDLKQIISASSLSLNDKERMDIIDGVYKDVKDYHNLVRYYTNKNISVSFIRAKKQNDTARVLQLYGTADQKYY